MIDRLRGEWQGFRAAVAGLSPNARRAAVVFLVATVLVLFHLQVGGRRFYTGTLDNVLGFEDPAFGSWAWWFGMQGMLGFVVIVRVDLNDRAFVFGEVHERIVDAHYSAVAGRGADVV